MAETAYQEIRQTGGVKESDSGLDFREGSRPSWCGHFRGGVINQRGSRTSWGGHFRGGVIRQEEGVTRRRVTKRSQGESATKMTHRSRWVVKTGPGSQRIVGLRVKNMYQYLFFRAIQTLRK